MIHHGVGYRDMVVHKRIYPLSSYYLLCSQERMWREISPLNKTAKKMGSYIHLIIIMIWYNFHLALCNSLVLKHFMFYTEKISLTHIPGYSRGICFSSSNWYMNCDRQTPFKKEIMNFNLHLQKDNFIGLISRFYKMMNVILLVKLQSMH